MPTTPSDPTHSPDNRGDCRLDSRLPDHTSSSPGGEAQRTAECVHSEHLHIDPALRVPQPIIGHPGLDHRCTGSHLIGTPRGPVFSPLGFTIQAPPPDPLGHRRAPGRSRSGSSSLRRHMNGHNLLMTTYGLLPAEASGNSAHAPFKGFKRQCTPTDLQHRERTRPLPS